jgi:hypothetical protein
LRRRQGLPQPVRRQSTPREKLRALRSVSSARTNVRAPRDFGRGALLFLISRSALPSLIGNLIPRGAAARARGWGVFAN